LATGVWDGVDALEDQWQVERVFEPRMSRDEAGQRRADWDRAVRQTLAGVDA
jgi:glycerol kinase